MSIEVERKFLCNADTLKTLEEMGAACVGQKQFHDQYFDTPEFGLTLKDVWLRKRKGCWELKCPTAADGTSGEQSKAAALCTRYREITSVPEIQLMVEEVLKGICKDRDASTSSSFPGDDESWLSDLNLQCFAEFTTVRRSFTLEEQGVHIDLDQADFGYNVGEIEVLVLEGEDVPSALEKIERTAEKLAHKSGADLKQSTHQIFFTKRLDWRSTSGRKNDGLPEKKSPRTLCKTTWQTYPLRAHAA